MNDDFWADDHFDFDDVINKQIHSDSPDEQVRIQPMSELTEPGSIGSQQAMIVGLDFPLPWVQDLVGRRSKEPGGVIVIGSAYAPFVRGISQRKSTMPLVDYTRVTPLGFQRNFLKSVVRPDQDYYGKIVVLLDGIVEASQTALFDLCRSSYAIRGIRVGRELDRAAEFTFKRAKCETPDAARVADERATYSRQTFIRYLDSEKQREWTRRRLVNTKATDIIALGYLAEHGILRLFYDLGVRHITPRRAPHEKWVPDTAQKDRWIINYAKRPLKSWLAMADWWEIKGTLDGQERMWRLLPVLHPCRNTADSGYEKTRDVLRAMIHS